MAEMDLVERLLQTAHDFELHDPERGVTYRGRCDVEAIREAADEITRLRRFVDGTIAKTAEASRSDRPVTDDLVEEVARVIFLKEGRAKDVLWEDADKVLALVQFDLPREQRQSVQDYYRDIARAAIATITRLRRDAPVWRCISTYDTKNDPDFALVCYEDGHVTPAEYMEYCVGGPDDHQTWSPVWPGKKTAAEYERDWPAYWQPLPKPNAKRPVEEPAERDQGRED